MEASICNQNFYKQLLCFHYFQESKYPRQVVKALNQIYGAGYISLLTVQKFYRQFAKPQFNLDQLMESYRDETYSYLDDKLKENENQLDTRSLENSDFIVRIRNYMAENPNAVVSQLKAYFCLSRNTISKYLHLAGYRFIIDKWILSKQDWSQTYTDESITDDHIRHYQQENPEASLNDMAQHFMINRCSLSKRIRRSQGLSVGLQLPSAKSSKKRVNQENDIYEQLNGTKSLGSKRIKTSSKENLLTPEQPVDLSSEMLSPPLTPPQANELSSEQMDKVLELATSAAIQNIITKNIFDRFK